MQVALIQSTCGCDKAQNLEQTLQQIQAAAEQGAEVVCLQELFATEYPCQAEDHSRFDLSESIPGPTCEALSSIAKRQEIVIIGSLFERRAAGVYHNSAVVLDTNGQLLGIYRKMHIPDDPLYYEKFYFTPGDIGFRAFDTSRGKVGVCICWDQWFPEAARLTALHGAEVIFYPTAIGWLPGEKEDFGTSQHAAWETMMRSHAIANGVFVAAANRVGREGEIEFWGASFVCDPYGNVVARASHNKEELVTANCDLQTVDAARTHWPFLRDRRIDAYDGLLRRMIDDSR
jgi:N-carbamoylputrescine amidase